MLTHIKAVIFDLDGTITEPYLDFAKIRREIGCPEGTLILDYLATLDDDAQRDAREKVDAWEADGARESTLNPGVREVLTLLAKRRIPTAVLTRNTRASVDTVMRKHGLHFDVVVAADDDLPVKPSPEPVQHIARELGVDARETLVVGDYLFDVDAGRAAGATTVYLSHPQNPDDVDAEVVITHMSELTDLLRAEASARRRPQLRIHVALIVLWLMLGLVVWWVFFVRTEAIPSSVRLWLILLVLAAVMWLVATVYRLVQRSCLARPVLHVVNARPALGEVVRFSVTLRARRGVTLDRVHAALSCAEETRGSLPGGDVLPVVVARVETTVAEGLRLAPGEPVDVAGELAVPSDGMPSAESHDRAVRWRLDVLVTLAGRIVRRVGETLRVQPSR